MPYGDNGICATSKKKCAECVSFVRKCTIVVSIRPRKSVGILVCSIIFLATKGGEDIELFRGAHIYTGVSTF